MSLIRLFFIMAIALGFVVNVPAYAAHKHKGRVHHHKAAVTRTTVIQAVDINSADVKTLQNLKGLSLKKAKAIVAYRDKNGDFKSVDDLTSVKAINKKFLAKLKKNNPGLITVGANA